MQKRKYIIKTQLTFCYSRDITVFGKLTAFILQNTDIISMNLQAVDGLIRLKYAYRNILSRKEGLIDNIYDTYTKTFWGADVLEFAEGDRTSQYTVANLALRAVNCHWEIGMKDTVFIEKLW